MTEKKTVIPIIRDTLQACQDSYSTHPGLVKKLRKYYDANDQDKFFNSFIWYLRLPISGVEERSSFTDRILEFVAKFACSFLSSGEEKAEKENDVEEEELPLFLYRLFVWLLDHHAVEGVDARLRVCQLLNKLLKFMGEEACIDDELYNKIYYGMLDRLKDKMADIRSQAVTALQRLQDPKNDECPIIKAYLFHLVHDPNPIVRRTIVRCIGATRLTLPHILERTRDVDEGVRRSAYKFLSDKVHIKSLTIGQREGVLQRGLKERSDAARKVVEKELIPSWLRLSNNNIIQLLHHLDVGNSEQDFKAGQQISAPAGALEVLFADHPHTDLVANFQYLDTNKLIPKAKLTPETALYWRVLIQYMSKKDDSEEYLDSLRPELSPFCDYVRNFILSLTPEDDDLNWEFIAKELIIICSFYDLGDEVGRRNLAKLLKDLLISNKISPTLIPQLVYIFRKVEKSTQARIEQIAEIISEIKEPMAKDSFKTTESNMDTVENIDHKLIRSLQLEMAKLKVDLSTSKDELATAIAGQDFISAQQIKQRLTELEAKRAQFEQEIETEKGRVIQVETIVETPAVVGTEPEDPEITMKCLKLLVATLQDPSITQLNATLFTLLEEVVVVAVQNQSVSIRKEAILALNCFCLRSIENARCHMLLFLQAAHVDRPEVRIAAITAVIDLLMMHGMGSFITTAAPAAADLSGTEGELSETGSSIETALESDMATRGSELTQNELNTQGGNSVVAILSKMLDEPDLELRTEVAEGLCKLLMIGSISSPKLLSRLLLMWYNPMTESDSKLRHILGTFFPLYASMNKTNQLAMESAFIPTMKVLFDAPVTSPLAEIDTEDVGMFFVHLTREDLLQNYEPQRKDVEGESTVSSVHDALAFAVCNEILSSPDSLQTKILIKILSNLQITHNNFVGLRELKVLSEQLLKHVKEKLCRKSLEKFDKSLQDWLARDPSKSGDLPVEKRPIDESETSTDVNETFATPGKKKRILFSQSVLGNPLLDVEQPHEFAVINAMGEISPRKIPSPVVRSNKELGNNSTAEFEKRLDSATAQAESLSLETAEQDKASSTLQEEDMEQDSEQEKEKESEEEEEEEERVRIVPPTPETTESEASSADAGTDTELSTPTTLHRRGLRKIVEDTPSPAVSRGSRKGRKPVTSESSGVSSPERRGGKVPETPEKVIRGRPLVPGSPGVSRSGRRNSPRIDYRTGNEIVPDSPLSLRKVTTKKCDVLLSPLPGKKKTKSVLDGIRPLKPSVNTPKSVAESSSKKTRTAPRATPEVGKSGSALKRGAADSRNNSPSLRAKPAKTGKVGSESDSSTSSPSTRKSKRSGSKLP